MDSDFRSQISNAKPRGGQRVSNAARLLLAAVALTFAVGCPPSEPRVIRTLPPPPVPSVKRFSATPPPPPPPPVAPPAVRPSVNLTGKRILIDPGHGGKDPGAWKGTRSRLPEKSIVLDIGNDLGRILKNRGANVIATRSKDVFPSLEQRAAAADRYRVDLFVSIHADSAPKNPAASGTELYIQQGTAGRSLIAARCIVAAIKKAGIECRGIQPKNLHVLRENSRPAILIECGFLTNSGDASRLNNDAYRARLAAAIADGITDYFAGR